MEFRFKPLNSVVFILVMMMVLGLMACQPVNAPDEIPTLSGTVSINGTAQVGATLSADTSALDGEGVITYQWFRGESAKIGSGGNSYTPVAADIGSSIKVQVSRAGYEGTVTSKPTAAVAAAPGLEETSITGFTFASHNTLRLVDSTVRTGQEIGIIAEITGGTPPYNFSLVGGEGDTDNALFIVDNWAGDHPTQGSLKVGSSALSEAKTYSVRIQVRDSKNQTFEKACTFNVPDTGITITEGWAYFVNNDDTLTIIEYSGDITGTLTIPASIDGKAVKAIQGATDIYGTSELRGIIYNNSSITNIVIPNSVTKIDNGAFRGSTGLTSITIPDSVTSIGDDAFWACPITDITIPDSVVSIGERAFYHCTSLTSITIPDSVISIGKSAFYYCIELTSITIPDSITAISDSMFLMSGLASITIPDSVTSIGNKAFANTNLTSITIPDSVTYIGNGAFENSYELTSITIGPNVTLGGDSVFVDLWFRFNSLYQINGAGTYVKSDNSWIISGIPGTVHVTGNAIEGFILTADISDVGGAGTISYQWYRGELPISGARRSTYTLTEDDIGNRIKVVVERSYCTGTLSAETEVIAPATLPALIGTVDISGTARVGETLTATPNLNGAGTISYQWYRGGTSISGATDDTYTLDQADMNAVISVQVSRSDCDGTVASNATSAVTNPLTGTVSINGSAIVGQTLTVNTGGLGGSGTISYQWYRGTTVISTESTYLLSNNDAGRIIKAEVSRSDRTGTVSGVTAEVIYAAPDNLTISTAASLQIGSGNVDAGDSIGTFSGPVFGNTPYTWTLVSGTGATDNALFTISSGVLSVGSATLTAARTYSIRVRITDSEAQTFDKVCTFTVDYPPVTDFTFTATNALQVGESNVSPNSIAGSFSNPLGGASPFSYSLVSGSGSTDNSLFLIDGNNLRVGGLALGAAKTYFVRVRITDSAGKTYDKYVTLPVDPPNPPITGFTWSAADDLHIGSGNIDAGDTIGTITAVSGGTASFTYALVSGAGSADNSLFTIDGTSLKVGSSALTEARDYSVRVQVTDSKGKTYTKTFTFTVAEEVFQGGVITILPPDIPEDPNMEIYITQSSYNWLNDTIVAAIDNSDNDFSYFAWYMDGTAVLWQNSSQFSVEANSYSLGRHSLTLVATKRDDGKDYSKTVQFTIVR